MIQKEIKAALPAVKLRRLSHSGADSAIYDSAHLFCRVQGD